MVSVIFAVSEVSFWALTTVLKLPWKFLTLIIVRTTRQVNWRKQTYLFHPHPLTDSHEILHTWLITSTISPQRPHLIKIDPGVTSPYIAEVTTQFIFIYFFLCTQNLSSFHGPRAQVVEPILTRNTPTDTQGSAYRGLEHSIYTSSP